MLDELIRFMEGESGEALCSVLLLEEDGELRWCAAPSLPEPYLRAMGDICVGASGCACTLAAHRRELVIISDIARDPLWSPAARAAALEHGLKACTSTPILGSRGEVLGTFAFYYRQARGPSPYDLTLLEASRDLAGIAIERSRTFAALEEALTARDTFLAIASHELRTPITTLLLQTRLLGNLKRRGIPEVPMEDLAPKVERLERQAGRLGRLVEQFLDAAQLLSGRFTLAREPVDLGQVAREAVESLSEALASGQCPVEIRGGAGVVGEGDPARLRQVIEALLSNALKFGAGKPIEITVERGGLGALIAVRDHGIGIALADQARIFRRFERAVSAQHYGGFGLGLWLARQLVEGMGGRIGVQSAPGSGATFVVELRSAYPAEENR